MSSRSLRTLISCGFFLVLGWSLYSQGAFQVGYAVLSTAGQGTTPVSTALFRSLSSDGSLIWEAGVEASQTLSSGRVFVDRTAGTRTALALVNPSAEAVTTTLTLLDSGGMERSRTSETFAPGEHRALYIQELGFEGLDDFQGSLTFETTGGQLAAITLRQNNNLQNEAIFATLPVVDLSSPTNSESIIFPQVGAGQGLSTQIVLINPTDDPIRGRMELFVFDPSGAPVELALDGVAGSDFAYEIPANGTFQGELTRATGLADGFALITPDSGYVAPSGSAIFQFISGSAVISEAGVGSAPRTRRARLFVDQEGTRTGVALANPAGEEANVDFALLALDGSSLREVNRTLEASNHLAIFADELFAGLADDFVGLMEIRSDVAVAPVTLKVTGNGRGQTILTTLPVADLEQPLTATRQIFAQIGLGDFGTGSFATRLILIDDRPGDPSTGSIDFFLSNGSPMSVLLAGQSGNRFSWDLAGSGGLELRPGDGVPAQIILDQARPNSTEVTVNQGNSLQLSPVVLNAAGDLLNHPSLSYISLDDEFAGVDASGLVTGKKAGFSTLTVSDGELIKTATITVTEVNATAGGFGATGVAQDLRQRIYLANSDRHTILRALDLNSIPETYAGIQDGAGFVDDERRLARFNRPAFLAVDQALGTLYVSDEENHAIRLVELGAEGRVRTLGGDGNAGSVDGPLEVARFNRPQGIALDREGGLWVADSANHVVRRVDLVSETVLTIAGVPGQPGLVDGTGAAARFNSPAGLAAIEETYLQRLERQNRLEPLPPISVVVADAGNGVVRRVFASGLVETVNATLDAATRGGGRIQTAAPAGFQAPAGVAVDAVGNILVTEPSAGQVRMILASGPVVDAVQPGTFSAPRGVVALGGGQVIVADAGTTAGEVTYGAPQITGISPSEVDSRGGDTVTIVGRNFAPETALVVSGAVIQNLEVQNTQTLVFTAPELPSGRGTVTVENRGGLAQSSVLVQAVALSSLPTGHITTVAGGSTFSGDGSEAIRAALRGPRRTAVDRAGNLYIVDRDNHKIRRIDAATGIITTVAGTGVRGTRGEGGLATAAQLSSPDAVRLDAAGNLYVLDTFRVAKVDAASGMLSRLFSLFSSSYSIVGEDFTIAENGDLCIADFNSVVYQVDAVDGSLSVVAGTGQFGFSGDGGPATQAKLGYLNGLLADAGGNLYISEWEFLAGRVRRVDAATGIITTLVAGLTMPNGMALDSDGTLYVIDTVQARVWAIDPLTGGSSVVAGSGEHGFSGDGGPAILAELNFPQGVVVDGSGNLYIADTDSNRIRKVEATNWTISTLAGDELEDLSGDGGPGGAALLASPRDLVFDRADNLYFSERDKHRIRKLDTKGVISTVVGTGSPGFAGDGGPAGQASLDTPEGIEIDSADNLFLADSFNDRIRRIDGVSGRIATVAGGGFQAPPVLATLARLPFPTDVAADIHGNLYIADDLNNVVYRVETSTRVMATYAGTPGMPGFSGDGGPATAARLDGPVSLALDSDQNLYIADRDNHRVRRVDSLTGVISTVAGNGETRRSGDGGPATEAGLFAVAGIAVDSNRHLYIGGFSIRRVDLSSGIILPVTGEGFGTSGDGGPAREASVTFISGLALDSFGNLYLTDIFDNRVRAIRGPLP